MCTVHVRRLVTYLKNALSYVTKRLKGVSRVLFYEETGFYKSPVSGLEWGVFRFRVVGFVFRISDFEFQVSG